MTRKQKEILYHQDRRYYYSVDSATLPTWGSKGNWFLQWLRRHHRSVLAHVWITIYCWRLQHSVGLQWKYYHKKAYWHFGLHKSDPTCVGTYPQGWSYHRPGCYSPRWQHCTHDICTFYDIWSKPPQLTRTISFRKVRAIDQNCLADDIRESAILGHRAMELDTMVCQYNSIRRTLLTKCPSQKQDIPYSTNDPLVLGWDWGRKATASGT